MNEIKLRPAVKKMWLGDLTSGEFPQGKEWLRDENDNYCCLGVLCERFRRTRHKGKWVWIAPLPWEEKGHWEFQVDGESASGALPDAVAKWAGLTYDEETRDWRTGKIVFHKTGIDDPEINDMGLSSHNDGLPGDKAMGIKGRRPKNFTKISELIRKHL